MAIKYNESNKGIRYSQELLTLTTEYQTIVPQLKSYEDRVASYEKKQGRIRKKVMVRLNYLVKHKYITSFQYDVFIFKNFHNISNIKIGSMLYCSDSHVVNTNNRVIDQLRNV